MPKAINIRELTDQTRKYASSGLIDPTSNMFNDRVFIYHGMNDSILLQGHVTRHTHLFNFSIQHSLCTVCFQYRSQCTMYKSYLAESCVNHYAMILLLTTD